MNTTQIVRRAFELGTVVPAFNVPYLPMVKPVIEAVQAENSFALVQVARLEWEKFEAISLQAVRDEYKKWENNRFVHLHLDHVPAIDEDNLEVDYTSIIKEALSLGYESIMVDASRLDLAGNIVATRIASQLAHAAGVPCEAELGAVLGHESGPMPPYEEIFKSGKGFTKIDEAERFVKESGCDWLSVAVGNVHGAISEATRDQKKPDAKLDVEHIQKLKAVTGIPLVLHGGSGIQKCYILQGIKNGIAKINVGTEIRHAYEQTLKSTGDVNQAQEATYNRTRDLLKNFFEISGNHDLLGLD